MNAIGYVRLSVKDQSKYSLEYQEQSIRDYCSRNNLNLTALFKDNGESSYTFDRPDYQAVETFLKKHRGENQYLIIMDHDRFSRNLPEALTKITELEKKYQIKVLATNESIDIDTSDPAVFMQRAFSYLMANQELFRIRKRTRDGIRQAHSSGRYVNTAPLGYRKGKDGSDKTMLLVDDQKAIIIQKIFEEYLSGTPVFLIQKIVQPMGFKNKGNSAIPRILSNPLYAGLIRLPADKNHPERLIKALHQPIVSEVDYWRAQEKLGIKRPSKTQPREEFPLRGILKCWCGKSMTAGFSKGKNKYYLYYRCIEHTSVNLPGDMLHEKMEDLLESLSFTKQQVQKINADARTLMADATKDKQKILEARTKQLADINKKFDRLEERLMDDEIDGGTYKRWHDKYSKERAILQYEINEANNGGGDVKGKWQRLAVLLPELSNLRSIYNLATFPNKQLLIKGVFKHNLTFSDGAFRTPSIEPAFIGNSLIAKEKGLLFSEEPNTVWEQVPCSSTYGNRTCFVSPPLQRFSVLLKVGTPRMTQPSFYYHRR